MQDTGQKSEQSGVLSRGSIRPHSAAKLGHSRCTFTLLCFQWYAMRVCCMVTFITHPLSGPLFNTGLQMSGSIPAFTGKGCRLLICTGQTCRRTRFRMVNMRQSAHAEDISTDDLINIRMWGAVSGQHLHNNFTL